MKFKSTLLLATSLLATLGTASAVTIVPGGFQSTAGNGQSTDPFDNYGTGGSRFQQVYNASLFGTFSNSELITSVAFRPKQAQFGSFIGNTLNISNLTVQLSTTSRNDAVGLSGIFSNNIGSDVQTVFTGPLSLTAVSAGPGISRFDYLITFQTPFLYEKTDGNLLLDILIPDNATISGSGSIGFRQIDTTTDAFPSADGMSTARGAKGSDLQGSNSTLAVITQFTSRAGAVAVPESANLLLMLLPVFGVMHFCRQRSAHPKA